MNEEQFQFLQHLVQSTGPSGYEAQTQAIWRSRVESVADSIHTDVLGNCTAALNTSARPRVMLDAHNDEIGFIIRYIDDEGFIWFATIGGFDPSTLPGNRVRILGKKGPVMGVIGRKAAHLVTEEERKKAPEISKMWIDIGARSRAEAESVVSVGDGGGRVSGMTRLLGNLVTSNSLDDRVGTYVVAETLRNLAGTPCVAGVYGVASTQEEIGLRGARAAAYAVEAEIGIALEVTWTTDHPHSSKPELGDIRVGGGPAIFRGANVNPRVFERLAAAAEAEGIAYQVDIYAAGSPTDGNAMQMSRSGMAVGIMSVPTRYLHTNSEVASLDDIDATVAVLTRFVRDLDGDVDLTP